MKTYFYVGNNRIKKDYFFSNGSKEVSEEPLSENRFVRKFLESRILKPDYEPLLQTKRKIVSLKVMRRKLVQHKGNTQT